MWRSYFGKEAHIYGVDLEPACRVYENPGTRIFIGDQADKDLWSHVIREVPRIDVVIDDGGHQPGQQIATLEALLPHLQPGGVYICEDIHKSGNLFLSYLDGLSRNLHAMHLTDSTVNMPVNSNELQRLIDSVHLYPYLAVIERRSVGLDRLEAPKHGTEWQPFLDLSSH